MAENTRGEPEANRFDYAAEHALRAVVEEYERRLNLGVDERGPNLLHEAEHLAVEFDQEGRAKVTLSLPAKSRSRALGDLARGMESFFAPDDDVLDAESQQRLEFDASAEQLAEEYLSALGLPGLSAAQLEALVGLSPPGRAAAVRVPDKREGHWWAGASLVWQRVREVVAQGSFVRVEGSEWPTADLGTTSRMVSGHAVLMPRRFENGGFVPPEDARAWAEIMWRQREELSDLDADMLDALCAVWISQRRDSALATVDDLLWMRGVKPKLGGAGRRGGYEPEQREAVMRALTRIENIWLTVAEMEVYKRPEGSKKKTKPAKMAAQSRAFVITDRVGQMRLDGSMEVEQFRFRPGEVFAHYLAGPGKQLALLSAAALAYDPYREVWEKRLAKYVSWQWKAGKQSGHHQPYKVSTLLERAGQKVETRNPLRTRERLEKALERLRRDGVVADWQYDRFHDRLEDSRKGWVVRWLETTVVIEPPDVVKEISDGRSDDEAQAQPNPNRARKKITVAADRPQAVTGTGKDPLVEAVRRRRKELKLSQLRLSEKLGVSQALISKAESGKEPLSPGLRKNIQAWIEETGSPKGSKI